jgi:hypothetical protein
MTEAWCALAFAWLLIFTAIGPVFAQHDIAGVASARQSNSGRVVVLWVSLIIGVPLLQFIAASDVRSGNSVHTRCI